MIAGDPSALTAVRVLLNMFHYILYAGKPGGEIQIHSAWNGCKEKVLLTVRNKYIVLGRR